VRGRRQVHRRCFKVCTIGEQSFGSHKLNQLLKNNRQFRLLQEENADSGERLEDGAETVLILDALSAGSALSGRLRLLRARFPKGRVLALGNKIPSDEQCRLIHLGVDGFLRYEEIERQLRPALRAMTEGRPWIAPEVLAQYVAYSRSAHTQSETNLTKRELEVLGLVARAFSNKEISDQLHITESTVKFHLANAFTKLGVDNRRAAVERMKTAMGTTPQAVRL
jgi:DNA-binding NarL/FixJ family response regulator